MILESNSGKSDYEVIGILIYKCQGLSIKWAHHFQVVLPFASP